MDQCPLCGSSNVDPATARDELVDAMLDAALAGYRNAGLSMSHRLAMRLAIDKALDVQTLR